MLNLNKVIHRYQHRILGVLTAKKDIYTKLSNVQEKWQCTNIKSQQEKKFNSATLWETISK